LNDGVPDSPQLKRLLVLAGAAASIYALNRIFLVPTYPEATFLRRHLGDVLALPVYLPLSIYLAWRLKLISGDFQLNLSQVLLAVLVFGVLFEGLIPMMDAHAFGDIYDVFSYLLGGLVVYFVSKGFLRNHKS